MANLSVFPNGGIDSFIRLSDLPANLYADAEELKTLKQLTTPTDTQITRMNTLLVELAPYYMSTNTWNKLCDCIVNMEDFTYEKFQNYYKYCGVYNPSTIYDLFNSVKFNGNTYISLKQQTGVQPIDDGVNWFQNSSRGSTYVLNIIGTVGTIIYDQDGKNPSPSSISSLSCILYENGIQVNPESYSWTTPSSNSMISGSSTIATFTPVIASNFNASYGNNIITLTITYNEQTFIQYFPIAITKIGSTGVALGLSYIGNYNDGQTYSVGNAVNFNNNIYYCINPTTGGNKPTSTLYWNLFLSNSGIVIQNTTPLNPYANMVWIDTSTSQNIMKYYNGSAWIICGNMASNISITDTGNIITANNVEDALQEIFTDVGNKNNLTTTDKSSTVNAINETVNKIEILNGNGDVQEKTNKSDFESHLADNTYQPAGGTATAITLTIGEALTDGLPINFKCNSNNSGSPTTINGKPFYKPGGTSAPNLIAGKYYTAVHNVASSCFFIKASAEGDAVAENVLAGKKFSNDNDTGLTGTMPNNGALNFTPSSSPQTIPPGYTSGGTVAKGYSIGDAIEDYQLKITSLGGKNIWTKGASQYVRGISADSSGNVYIVGSNGSSGYNNFYKLSPTGETLSSRDLGISYPWDIIVNTDGSYLIAFRYAKSTQVTLAKYDANNVLIWSSYAMDYPDRMAVDASGNIYVAAQNDGNGTAKLNSSGNAIWRIGAIDGSVDIALDSSGNIYTAHNSTLIVVRKIANNGTLIWKNESIGYALCIDVDSKGNVYAGYNNGSIRKFNSSGVIVWTISNLAPCYGIKVDEHDNIYCSFHGSPTADPTVMKLDSDGNEIWSYTGLNFTGEVLYMKDDFVYVGSLSTVKKIIAKSKYIIKY